MHKYQLIICFFLAAFMLPADGTCQDRVVIQLRNPSFEDYPRAGTDGERAPLGWYDCGKPGETAPDVHPAMPPDNFFSVTTPSFDGNTYLGLVARSNETWEAVGQRLSKPLEKGKAYSFGLYLAQSPTYLSPVKKGSEDLSNYNTPVLVKIWGGNGYCKRDELLDESGLINHPDWRQYQFRFEPQKSHTFIRIEAYWKTPTLAPYRGNVLVDNATAIFEVPVDKPSEPLPGSEEAPIVKILNPLRSGRKSQDNTFLVEAMIDHMPSKNGVSFSVNGQSHKFSFDPAKGNFKSNIILNRGDNKFRIKASNASGTHQDEAVVVYTPKKEIVSNTPPRNNPKPPPAKQAYTLNPELENKPTAGAKLRITDLRFAADSYVIEERAYAALDEFANYLLVNPEVRVEVGGHTNDRCQDSYCNTLSENRAKAVANYLKEKGVGERRIIYKGYGKTQPIYGNRYEHLVEKNQRVEIKIL